MRRKLQAGAVRDPEDHGTVAAHVIEVEPEVKPMIQAPSTKLREGVPEPEVRDAAGPNVASFRLDNGLDVVVIPDRRAPVVTHMVWYRNGSADDPVGKSGIAHFLEHLMFKGTAAHPEGEFSDAVAARGGQDNAFTSFDYTA
jgi:zinc protease